ISSGSSTAPDGATTAIRPAGSTSTSPSWIGGATTGTTHSARNTWARPVTSSWLKEVGAGQTVACATEQLWIAPYYMATDGLSDPDGDDHIPETGPVLDGKADVEPESLTRAGREGSADAQPRRCSHGRIDPIGCIPLPDLAD